MRESYRQETCEPRDDRDLVEALHSPDDRRIIPHARVDDDLRRIARAFAAAEENAFLEPDLQTVGAKQPSLAIRQQEVNGAALLENFGAHERVQMKAHRIFRLSRTGRAARRRYEPVLALDPAPVSRERQPSMMNDAEALIVSIMRSFDFERIGVFVTARIDLSGPGDHL